MQHNKAYGSTATYRTDAKPLKAVVSSHFFEQRKQNFPRFSTRSSSPILSGRNKYSTVFDTYIHQAYTSCAAMSAVFPAITRVTIAPQAKAPSKGGLAKLELDVDDTFSLPCAYHEGENAGGASRYSVRTPAMNFSLHGHDASVPPVL